MTNAINYSTIVPPTLREGRGTPTVDISNESMLRPRQKVFGTADVVRDAMFQQSQADACLLRFDDIRVIAPLCRITDQKVNVITTRFQ